MYLISIYFDEQTEKHIRNLIRQVADKTGNTFMTAGNVPPHITISAFETKHEQKALSCLEQCAQKLSCDSLFWASVGEFFPHVIYLAPVLNEYLHQMSVDVYDAISDIEDISISRYYRPLQWLPHTTIGKQLTTEEMSVAFEVLQHQFGSFEGTVTRIGLAKTNPYRDLAVYELKKAST